jgi:hypothetical protein
MASAVRLQLCLLRKIVPERLPNLIDGTLLLIARWFQCCIRSRRTMRQASTAVGLRDPATPEAVAVEWHLSCMFRVPACLVAEVAQRMSVTSEPESATHVSSR